MPPQAADPRPTGKTPSPATADDELQEDGPLEEVEGLTDNKAGG